MIDKRKTKIVDQNKHVWLCISCSRRVISETRPEICPCSQSNYVIESNLVVTK